MVVVEPIFAKIALEHEVLDVVNSVGLLAMTVNIEESVIVMVLFVYIFLFNNSWNFYLFFLLLILVHF